MAAAKKKTSKRSNVGLKAARVSPLRLKVYLSHLRNLNRRTLVIVALLVVITGGYIFYRGTHAGSYFTPYMTRGTTLYSGGYLQSADDSFYATLQGDGNFVIFRQSTQKPVWATGTNGKGVKRMVYQNDGNLVMFNSANGVVWYTHSQNLGGTHMTLRNDGLFVNYTSNNTPIWASNAGLFCRNPLAGQAYNPERTDRGVDYQMGDGASVNTPCSGTIVSTNIPGWGHDNAYITVKLTSYPSGHPELLGKCIYFAEDIRPTVALNQAVYAGDRIGSVHNSGTSDGQMEWGWSRSPGNPSSPKAPNDGITVAGNAMARFMRSLGATTGYVPPMPGPLVDGTPCG